LVCADLLWWQIRTPTPAEISAAITHPAKRQARAGAAATAAAAAASAASAASAAAAPVQPAHVLEMHFIQVKVGKSKYDLPASSLSEAFRFSNDHRQFERVQCSGMTVIGQDVAWNAALGGGALPKQYSLETHFHLVASRHVSGPTKKLLDRAHIELISAADYSMWGPRVRQFCTAAAAPFTLFQ
jgi:hypothetical protein